MSLPHALGASLPHRAGVTEVDLVMVRLWPYWTTLYGSTTHATVVTVRLTPVVGFFLPSTARRCL